MLSAVHLHIAERIHNRRVELKLDIADLSERTNRPEGEISAVEAGLSPISAHELLALSKALNAPLWYFFEGGSRRQAVTRELQNV